MDIPPSAYPAIGAITAAIIAGGISFVVTVLSKEQKTSEFRQAWIDALREELSEFVSTVDTISSFLRLKTSRGHQPEELVAYLEERHDDVSQMGVMYHRIRLRLNPKEHINIVVKLKELLSVMSSHEKALDATHVDKLIDEVVTEGQALLKSEWKRVKRGEMTFVITKYVSLALLFLAICFAIAASRGYVIITFRV